MEHTYKSSSHHTHVSRSARRACAHGAKIHPQMARRCSRSSCGPSARSWFSRATAPSRCCKIVMLEQHRPQPRRASARSHARGGRSGSAQARQPAAAEAPDTHTRCVSWGWVSRGGMIMAVVQARVLAGDSPRWWDATALIRRAQALRVLREHQGTFSPACTRHGRKEASLRLDFRSKLLYAPRGSSSDLCSDAIRR